jgi:hypothetical protein
MLDQLLVPGDEGDAQVLASLATHGPQAACGQVVEQRNQCAAAEKLTALCQLRDASERHPLDAAAVLSLSAGAHYMQVSKWLGHESYVTTLTIYADYIDETEGGKAVPLARPTAPDPAPAPAPEEAKAAPSNVVQFRRRNAG